MHPLPDGWQFNGNVDRPTFSPSFRHCMLLQVFKDGKWTGEWRRDGDGNVIQATCHYVLTDGILNFCDDCTHELAGKSMPLPELPEGIAD